MDRKMMIQIALPFFLIIMSLIISKFITFQPLLTTKEMGILNSVPDKINLNERQPLMLSEDLKSPMEMIKAPAKGFPSIPLSAIAPQTSAEVEKPSEIKVSMIAVSEQKKIAIVSGIVTKEGDSISGMKVLRIEKDRILLKDIRQNGGTKWAYLEKIK